MDIDAPEPICPEPEPAPQPESEPEPPVRQPYPEPEPAVISGPRIHCLPRRLLDFPMSSRSESMVHQLQRPPSPSPEPIQQAVAPVQQIPDRPHSPELQKTEPDEFGLYRAYVEHPSHESNDSRAPDYGCDAPTFDNVHNASAERQKTDQETDVNPFSPFANVTKFRLTNWIYSMTKSNASFDSLVNDVIKADDFDVNDLEDWNTACELKTLDRELKYSTQGPSKHP